MFDTLITALQVRNKNKSAVQVFLNGELVGG